MFLHIEQVTHLKDFTRRVEFSDGSVRAVDLSAELDGEIFEPLRDPEFFSQVTVNPETGTIEWPLGADRAPEFLHEKGTNAEQVA